MIRPPQTALAKTTAWQSKPWRRLVEAAGIEPASEKFPRVTSTGLAADWSLAQQAGEPQAQPLAPAGIGVVSDAPGGASSTKSPLVVAHPRTTGRTRGERHRVLGGEGQVVVGSYVLCHAQIYEMGVTLLGLLPLPKHSPSKPIAPTGTSRVRHGIFAAPDQHPHRPYPACQAHRHARHGSPGNENGGRIRPPYLGVQCCPDYGLYCPSGFTCVRQMSPVLTVPLVAS